MYDHIHIHTQPNIIKKNAVQRGRAMCAVKLTTTKNHQNRNLQKKFFKEKRKTKKKHAQKSTTSPPQITTHHTKLFLTQSVTTFYQVQTVPGLFDRMRMFFW